MNESEQININFESLMLALNKAFNKKIIHADYQTKQLHGGSVGNVILVTGRAETFDGEKLPYKLVLKIQKKWEREGDANSWRREYDLYVSDLDNIFSNSYSLRWAKCYHAEMNGGETETQLWIEYIEGISGYDLTLEMREFAALEIGRFQGRIYKQNPPFIQNISCFTEIELTKNYYMQNRTDTAEYLYICSRDCPIPKHLRQMIIDVYNEIETIFSNYNNMPVVLCHRDFWFENIIYSDSKIILIDWDCTGWGYMFEDIIQLITDETDTKDFDEYYRKFIPAYIKGFSEYVDISQYDKLYAYAWKMLVIKFARNYIYWYMSSKSSDEKQEQIDNLQKMYEMGDINFEHKN